MAWSGGGRQIIRVDVSVDSGKTFTAAELYKPIQQRRNRHWAWTQFSKKVPLLEDVRKKLENGEAVNLDITSKAMKSDFNVQPETIKPYWNARGVCINHWYHVSTTLDPNRAKGEVEANAAEYKFGNTPSGGKFKAPWDAHGWLSDPKHRSDPKANVAPESSHF